MAKKKNEIINFPRALLAPIQKFLEGEVKKLRKRREGIKKNDPFFGEGRESENSLEEDVDEQIGHFNAEVKAGFVAKQIVQVRKALTMIRIGKYGQCEKCSRMIDTDRLAVKPETTICIECEKERHS